MSSLPPISGKEFIAALKKAGFYEKRQEESHVMLRRYDPFALVVVPLHKTLVRGTLGAIIKQAGMGTEDFIRLL